ncbi:MAG: alginate export family protein [Fimbriimonadaceae bacterium]
MDAPATPQPIWDFEIRERFERRLDRDFDFERSDNANLRSDRVRVGFRHEADGIKIRVQYQYARTSNFLDGGGSAYQEYSDLSESYVEGGESNWKLRVGRFRTSYGSGRLIACPDWSSPGRSFEGVQATVDKATAFALRQAVNPAPNTTAAVAGVQWSEKSSKTLAFYHENKRSGTEKKIWTISHLQKAKTGKWSASLEAAGQAGDMGGKDHAAAAFALEFAHPIPKGRAMLQGLWASGGESADHSRSFEAPFPASRYVYGMMDAQAWRNIRYLSAQLDLRLDKRTTLCAIGSAAWLEDPKDAWYASSNRPYRARVVLRDPTGRSGREVGYELSLEAVHTVQKGLNLSVGAAAFRPGRFVRNVTGSNDTQYLGWVQIQWRM